MNADIHKISLPRPPTVPGKRLYGRAQREFVESTAGSATLLHDRYLGGCGATDVDFRPAISGRVLSRLGWHGAPDFLEFHAAVDKAPREALELDEGAVDGRSGFRSPDVRSVPLPSPKRMPTQDLSVWTPRRALSSLLTRLRPTAAA